MVEKVVDSGMFVTTKGEEIGTTVEYMEELSKLPPLDEAKHVEFHSIRDVKMNGKTEKTLVFKTKNGSVFPDTDAKEEAGRYWVKNMKTLTKKGFVAFAFPVSLSAKDQESRVSLTDGLDSLNKRLKKASKGNMDDDQIDDLFDDVSDAIESFDSALDDDDEDEDDKDDSFDSDEDKLGDITSIKKKIGFNRKNIAEGARLFRKLFKGTHGEKAAKRFKILTKGLRLETQLKSTHKDMSFRDMQMLMTGIALATGMDSKKNRQLLLGAFMVMATDMISEEDDD